MASEIRHRLTDYHITVTLICVDVYVVCLTLVLATPEIQVTDETSLRYGEEQWNSNMGMTFAAQCLTHSAVHRNAQ